MAVSSAHTLADSVATAQAAREMDSAASSALASKVAVSSASFLADSVAELAAIQQVLTATTAALATALEARDTDAAGEFLCVRLVVFVSVCVCGFIREECERFTYYL